MKRNQKRAPAPRDNPATRKKRLQERLQEISNKSEQELTTLMKSIEKLKDTLKSDKKDQ